MINLIMVSYLMCITYTFITVIHIIINSTKYNTPFVYFLTKNDTPK